MPKGLLNGCYLFGLIDDENYVVVDEDSLEESGMEKNEYLAKHGCVMGAIFSPNILDCDDENIIQAIKDWNRPK